MDALHAALTHLFDILLAPLAMAPAVELVVLSMLLGMAMAVVFKYTSNQRALARVADQTRAMMLCMRMFRDDPRVAVDATGTLLRQTGLRLLLSLRPMAVMVVPFAIIVSQLALRYEHVPLRPGQSCVVTLRSTPEGWATWRQASLLPPDGIEVETPGLRDDVQRTVSWRIRVPAPTESSLVFTAGEQQVDKAVVATTDVRPLRVVSVCRPGPSLWQRFVHPAEPSVPSSMNIVAIDMIHPTRATPLLGVDVPWWATLLIVSIASALLMKPIIRVQY